MVRTFKLTDNDPPHDAPDREPLSAEEAHDFARELCAGGYDISRKWAVGFVERIADAAYARGKAQGMADAAGIAEAKWPRGSAHTYASENSDRYRALEDASEYIAAAIREAGHVKG